MNKKAITGVTEINLENVQGTRGEFLFIKNENIFDTP